MIPADRLSAIEVLETAMGMTVAEQRELCRGYRAGLAAVPDGWKLVPVNLEPPEAMLPMLHAYMLCSGGFREVWAAVLAAAPEPPASSAMQAFKECDGQSLPCPLERLRFFCSLAMNGQDWLDAEAFFDDVRGSMPARRTHRRHYLALLDWRGTGTANCVHGNNGDCVLCDELRAVTAERDALRAALESALGEREQVYGQLPDGATHWSVRARALLLTGEGG